METGGGLTGPGGALIGVLVSVSGGGTSVTGDMAGTGGIFKKDGLEGKVCWWFAKESAFSNSPSCFQMSSSEGFIRKSLNMSMLKNSGRNSRYT
jgi:hypothetical protein